MLPLLEDIWQAANCITGSIGGIIFNAIENPYSIDMSQPDGMPCVADNRIQDNQYNSRTPEFGKPTLSAEHGGSRAPEVCDREYGTLIAARYPSSISSFEGRPVLAPTP